MIVPVHYAGIGCEMDTIMEIAKRHNLLVVEDASHGITAQYKNAYLGTIGDMGAYSFHETKNFICGEGGAIVINDEAYLERAEIIREKGTNRNKFFRGEVERYTWVDVGSSYLPSDLLAAFLYAQFESMEKIIRRRQEIFEYYNGALKPLEDAGLVRLPIVPPECRHNNHLFYIILKDVDTRDRLIKHMKEKGIYATFHFLPLHLSSVGRSLGYRDGQFPVTESTSSRLVRLPFYYDLTDEELAEIVGSVSAFFEKNHALR